MTVFNVVRTALGRYQYPHPFVMTLSLCNDPLMTIPSFFNDENTYNFARNKNFEAKWPKDWLHIHEGCYTNFRSRLHEVTQTTGPISALDVTRIVTQKLYGLGNLCWNVMWTWSCTGTCTYISYTYTHLLYIYIYGCYANLELCRNITPMAYINPEYSVMSAHEYSLGIMNRLHTLHHQIFFSFGK
jgi:hypothetical protein